LAKSTISKGVIKDIIIVVVGVLIIWIALQFIFGAPNPFYVVSSGSMVPVLEVYDVLVVQGNEPFLNIYDSPFAIPFEEIQKGDIIVFNRPSGQDRVIVHRVVTIIEDDPKTIRTKGDANPASIPGTDFPITEKEYIGKVQYVIPQIGYVTRILTPPINYIIIAIIIGIMIVKQISKNKKTKESVFEDKDESSHAPEDEPSKTELDIPEDKEYTESTKESKGVNEENIKDNPDKSGDINSDKKPDKKDSEKKPE